MTRFFTADTHFGDHRVLNLHRRPFTSAAEMDQSLTERWNRVVRPDDEVWHLGDFARSLRVAEEVLSSLNGRKHLLRGNNDPAGVELLGGWVGVYDYRELMAEEETLLVLCHYPFRSWNGQHRRSINLHGHSHGRLKALPRQIDVGVDAQDFSPVTLEQAVGQRAQRSGKLQRIQRA